MDVPIFETILALPLGWDVLPDLSSGPCCALYSTLIFAKPRLLYRLVLAPPTAVSLVLISACALCSFIALFWQEGFEGRQRLSRWRSAAGTTIDVTTSLRFAASDETTTGTGETPLILPTATRAAAPTSIVNKTQNLGGG